MEIYPPEIAFLYEDHNARKMINFRTALSFAVKAVRI